MTGPILCTFLVTLGLLQVFSTTGSLMIAAGTLLAAAILGVDVASRRSQKAIDRAHLASLEHLYAADIQLLTRGHELNEEERETFRMRAHDIGILRQRCGYIPKPDSFCAIDYRASIRKGCI